MKKNLAGLFMNQRETLNDLNRENNPNYAYMNDFKRRRALAGLPVSSITSYSMDMMEQYKQTSEYKKSKEAKENKRKAIIKDMKKNGKVDYQKAYEEAYKTSSSMEPKYKPRLRIR